jgi:hypothetical protein
VVAEGAVQPGSRRRRYEAITESRTRRLILYHARRHLHYSVDEWEGLPWWQQQLYEDGLFEEFYGIRAEVDEYDPGLDKVEDLGFKIRRVKGG